MITRFPPGSPQPPTRWPRFYECGICGHYHAEAWDGDCRQDDARFTMGELDEVYGTTGWTEVPMPGGAE